MTSIFSPQHDSGSGTRLLASPRRFRALPAAALVALVAPALVVAAAGQAQAAGPVRLGTTEGFAVLAGSAINNTGPTTVWGDVGVTDSATFNGSTSVTFVPPGVNHLNDGVTQGARTPLITAYDDAANALPVSATAADSLGGGQRLTAGIYASGSSILLNGALTLDGENNRDAVFIFTSVSDLTTGTGAVVNLVNGAQACNVFWKVGSSATLETGTAFRGTVLALTSITLKTGATVEGRVLARNGAVTMDTNVITKPGCATGTAQAGTSGSATGGAGSGQVRRVPRGAVDTGDGSSSAASIPVRRLFSADDTADAAASRLLG